LVEYEMVKFEGNPYMITKNDKAERGIFAVRCGPEGEPVRVDRPAEPGESQRDQFYGKEDLASLIFPNMSCGLTELIIGVNLLGSRGPQGRQLEHVSARILQQSSTCKG